MSSFRTLGSACEFLGDGRSRRAHALDECGTLNDLSAVCLGVGSDPHGDDGHLRSVPHSRRRCPAIFWRHLRLHRASIDNTDRAQ